MEIKGNKWYNQRKWNWNNLKFKFRKKDPWKTVYILKKKVKKGKDLIKFPMWTETRKQNEEIGSESAGLSRL